MMPGVVRGLILIPIGHLSQHHIPNAYIYPIGIRVVFITVLMKGRVVMKGVVCLGGLGLCDSS